MPVSKPARARKKLRFCPKCGTLMRPQYRNGRLVLVCPKCGYEEEMEGGGYTFESRSRKSPKDKIIVINQPQIPPNAVVLEGKIRCPKCGHDKILFWMMQTRAADEPPTRFYRCLKCGYSWREYD